MRIIDIIQEGNVFGKQDFDTQMGLAKMKHQLGKERPMQMPVANTPEEPPAKLSDLQAERDNLLPIMQTKKAVEELIAKLTKGGRVLPPGLAADLDDIYSIDDIKKYPQEVLAKYQKQLAQLQKYAAFKKAAWR